VTQADRQRLQAIGILAGTPEPWEPTADGGMALRRGPTGPVSPAQQGDLAATTPGFCLFLDSRQRCTIYDHRPAHCRAYPYLWTSYVWPELDVDFSCPGLGCGEVIQVKHRKPLAEDAARQIRRERAIQEIEGLLRAQQRYCAPRVLALLGQRCIDELATSWTAREPAGVSTLSVAQTRPLFANVEAKQALPLVWESLVLAPRSVEELLADDAFLVRHFARPRWNTRLGSGKDVTLYRFWIAERVLYVEERGGTRRETPLGDLGRLSWRAAAIDTRRVYLERWLKRQLPVRLANNMGVASPVPGGHAAVCYLEFLVEIDWRLAVLAPALARANDKEMVDRETALEAIRGSDGLLRAWCESARLGIAN